MKPTTTRYQAAADITWARLIASQPDKYPPSSLLHRLANMALHRARVRHNCASCPTCHAESKVAAA